MMLQSKAKIRILDFDTESRPLSYWYGDKTTSEITAIASCWADNIGSMETFLLGEVETVDMLQGFVDRYNEADIVTGHYIRAHDLPRINGALIEAGLPALLPKMTIDTRLDFLKKGDLPASQEALAEMFDIPVPKVQMSQGKWRKANRLSAAGIAATKTRVQSDVLQHMLLRQKLSSLNLLKPAKVWHP